MHIYLKNNPAKFHPDPIWNERALGFFEECHANKTKKKKNKKNSNTILIQKYKRLVNKDKSFIIKDIKHYSFVNVMLKKAEIKIFDQQPGL